MIKRKAIILIYIFLVFTAACGKKAPPRPPNVVLPNPPEELSFELEEDGVVLTFRFPESNAYNTDSGGFGDVEIFKAAVMDLNSFCPSCDDDYKAIYKGEVKISNGYAGFKDKEIVSPALYYYKVRAANSDNKGLSDFSAPIKVSLDRKKHDASPNRELY
jgi:hypothetical protein